MCGLQASVVDVESHRQERTMAMLSIPPRAAPAAAALTSRASAAESTIGNAGLSRRLKLPLLPLAAARGRAVVRLQEAAQNRPFNLALVCRILLA